MYWTRSHVIMDYFDRKYDGVLFNGENTDITR